MSNRDGRAVSRPETGPLPGSARPMASNRHPRLEAILTGPPRQARFGQAGI